MKKNTTSPIMKIVAKAAEKAAEGWPADNCIFWTYSPKKPMKVPTADPQKDEQE